MAPSSIDLTSAPAEQPFKARLAATGAASKVYESPALHTGHKAPLQLTGALDNFQSFDLTPIIGREYQNVNIAEWIRAPNSDDILRDLAITVSQRGVVFFRAQDDLTDELQKELAQRLGDLSGKPSSSGLYVFPIMSTEKLMDGEIGIITHEEGESKHKTKTRLQDPSVTPMRGMWHSDTTFENVTSDYAVLKMVELPKTGGDTLWASCYEIYDRLSKPLQAFFETLTFTGAQPKYNKMAEINGLAYYPHPRGSPENIGQELRATHPVVRTNPVTGWKSVFAMGHHAASINDVSEAESKKLLTWLMDMVIENHDLQVRHRWANKNDIAIWDNRCMVHTATPDYLNQGLGKRLGKRMMSIGEKPYLDHTSTGRREALAKAEQWN